VYLTFLTQQKQRNTKTKKKKRPRWSKEYNRCA